MATSPGPIALVIGGCRSGKSAHAQLLAEKSAPKRIYVATCVPRDPEMQERVRRHQKDRDASWSTIETPVDISGVIREHAESGTVLLVDCLTLWITNLLLDAGTVEAVEEQAAVLVNALAGAQGPVILVSNEVGQGIVPENRLARQFRDLAGHVNQVVAGCADQVIWMVAGIPVTIKSPVDSGSGR